MDISVKDFLVNKDDVFKKHFLKCFSLFYEIDFYKQKETFVSEKDLKKIIDITQKSILEKDITFDLEKKRFYNVDLEIERGVFVPQFDTEILVEKVLEYKNEFNKGLEVGIGTGAISISIMKNSLIEMSGIDINEKAINLTRKNIEKNKLNYKSNFKLGDVFNYNQNSDFDFLISNPPYIKRKDKFISKWVIDNQPEEALYAEEEGLKFYFFLINNYRKFIKDRGMMFFEIGFQQKNEIEEFLFGKQFIESFKFEKDLSSNWRCLIIKFK